MRLLLLLLSCTSLSMAACPRMLEGITRDMFDSYDAQLPDAVDTSCGRRNLTAVFWDTQLIDIMTRYMLRDAIRSNSTLCSPACVKDIEKRFNGSLFEPLVASLRKAFDAVGNAEAKAQINAKYAVEYRIRELQVQNTNVSYSDIMDEVSKSDTYKLSRKRLSREAEAACAQAMKRGFGVIETAETRRHHIETAMNALENTVIGRDDKEKAEIIEQFQRLINETYSFDQFPYWRYKNAEWIRPVEIVPAVEILYLQYRTLSNKEAKVFIDSFLSSWKDHYERPDSSMIHKLAFGKNVKTSFDSLPDETVFALKTAFPELFAYLFKHEYVAKKSQENI